MVAWLELLKTLQQEKPTEVVTITTSSDSRVIEEKLPQAKRVTTRKTTKRKESKRENNPRGERKKGR